MVLEVGPKPSMLLLLLRCSIAFAKAQVLLVAAVAADAEEWPDALLSVRSWTALLLLLLCALDEWEWRWWNVTPSSSASPASHPTQ
jgi:hypothetical protein